MILLQNQKLCLRLLGQGVVLHHPQNSSVPPREKEVGQNHQLNKRLWVGLLLGREVDLDLLKNLMRNPVHPLRKEVIQTLLQMLKLKHECHLDKGVVLDHLQRLIANPDLLLSLVGLAHPLKLKISQEQHLGHRVVLIPLLNPRLLPLGPFPDEADQVHQAKVEAPLLKEAAVLSLLQNTLPNLEWLEEALGHHSPRLSLAPHLVVTALDHRRGPGRPDSPVEVVLHLPHQRHVLELPHDADEVLQCPPQSQLKSQDLHAGGVQLHPPALRQLQGEVVLLHQSLVGSRGPVPGQGGRKPEQPDVEIGLDLLSQPLEEDSGAVQGLGLLVGVEEALVTTQGLLPGKRVHEPPLDVEEVALGHPQPVGSVPAHAHHQPHGSVPGLPLIGDPDPEHPWSADVGPGHVLHQSVGEDQDLGHQ